MAKPNRILALDIGASSLKLAEFALLKDGGIQLVQYGVRSMGMDPQEDDDRSRYIITTLRGMIQELGIKPAPVLITVSGQSVFSRFVKLPPADPDKIFGIVQYEAIQNVPFPIDEVVWDYQLIEGTEGEVDVMLAAIKGEIIESLTDCVSFAGLKADLVDVAPMALYNAVRYNYSNAEGCTLIIDMGARSTDLIFMEGNRVFSRSIPVAGNAITQQIMREFDQPFQDAEDLKLAHAFVAFGGAYEAPSSEVADKVSKAVRSVMTRMHAEINRSINFYRGQQAGSQPNLVLLTGGTSVIGYTDTFLREKLKVEVDYLNPFLNVAVAEHISAEEIGQHAHLLGEVVGLALRRALPCPIELNLMPPKVLEEKAFSRKQPVLLMAMIGVVLTVGIWCGFFFKMAALSQERLDRIQARANALSAIEARMKRPMAQVRQTVAQTEELGALLSQRTRWIRILDQIHGALSEGMWLTSIAPVKEEPESEEQPRTRRSRAQPVEPAVKTPADITKIEIAGYGYIDKVESSERITELRDLLRQAEDFTDETEIAYQPPPGPDDIVREFKIVVALEEPLKP